MDCGRCVEVLTKNAHVTFLSPKTAPIIVISKKKKTKKKNKKTMKKLSQLESCTSLGSNSQK